MKKFVAVFIAFSILLSFASASQDFSSYSDYELLSMIDSARVELSLRGVLGSQSIVLVDEEDFCVTITGNIAIDDKGNLRVEYIASNSAAWGMRFGITDAYVNGWRANVLGVSQLKGGKKERDAFTFFKVNETCMVDDAKSIDSIELYFYLTRLDLNKTVVKNRRFVIYPSAE